MYRDNEAEQLVATVKKVVETLNKLRAELMRSIISGEASSILEKQSKIIEGVAVIKDDDLLFNLAKKLHLLATFSQALYNQYKHIHSRRLYSRVNYIDRHLVEIIFYLQSYIGEKDSSLKSRNTVIRRLV